MSDTNKITINTLINGKRTSTQDLLQEIYKRLSEGYTSFEIEASGQHNIGGPLWLDDNKTLTFKVHNPGQRVGSMGMAGTTIIVEGSAPADVGWLNAGAEIIVKGDGGDTTAHCAASGKIYIGGRTGTRSGALMKHDPKFPAPEFWVLKNTGSFSFEFMGGGIAVVCGYDCENIDSVLGNRSCIGMVGGTVYTRGNTKGLSDEVWVLDLDQQDKDFLQSGLSDFLNKIDQLDILKELSIFSKWKKIVPKTYEERNIRNLMPAKEFRLNKWVESGIFGDLVQDDYSVSSFVETGDKRFKYPEWHNSSYSAPCEYNCPVYIPTQKRIALLREGKIEEALKLVLDYSPFPASVCGQVCPNLCVDDCNRKFLDLPVKTKELGLLSKNIKTEIPNKQINKNIAVIGSGAAGLTVASHLRKFGYKVDVFEEDNIIGGKLKQVIPEERLNREILDTEIKQIADIGVNFITGKKVDKDLFAKIEKDYDAVAVTIGAHVPVVLPVEGHEHLIKGLDFLKGINKSVKYNVGDNVVVIGAGNAAMDVVIGAYAQGAKEVTAIDIQQPAAFPKELEHAKKLGAKILWPCYTEKITKEGVYLKDGQLLKADTVIISVGDRSDFSLLGKNYLDEKGKVNINEYSQTEINPKIFVIGDAVKLGLFTHAIGEGRKAAINIDNMLTGRPLDKFEKAPMIPQDKVKSEFYPQINPQSVIEMSTEDEAKRCMSCGHCRDCGFCKDICPEQAISRIENINGFEYISDSDKCIGCGICAGVCPCGIWVMQDNLEKFQEA
jgi:NADPH-dependent glutamate synthase beta subunit-like oxidoreductase/glutamate synthase domain-containing protein 3/Pyruvate/2-oxoacid:ferredoxin oxidoreductase delta subunit